MPDSNQPPGPGDAKRARDSQNLDMLRQLVANSPDGMVVTQDRIVQYDNEGLYLSPEDDRIGHVFAERAAPEAQEQIWNTLDAVQRGDLPEARVEWRSTVTGRVIEAILRPTEYEDRPAVAAYLRDISERKRLTEDLAAMVDDLALYRRIFELSRDSIVLMQDGVVQLSNGALLSGGVTSIVGQRAEELFDPETLVRLRTEAQRILSGELEEGLWEWSIVGGSGRPRTVEGIARRIEYRGRPGLLINTRDISERKAIELRLEELSRTDSLTGIPNRRSFYESVDYWRAEASRNRTTHAVCFLDLDRFKTVNDGYGHQAGDDLLSDIARRLRATVRRTDIVARLGGDEFAVLLPDTTAAAAAHVADKLRAQVEEAAAAYPEVGVSIGLTTFDSDEEPDEIMSRADRDMYRVKMARRASAG